jgi:hypothetical protein
MDVEVIAPAHGVEETEQGERRCGIPYLGPMLFVQLDPNALFRLVRHKQTGGIAEETIFADRWLEM